MDDHDLTGAEIARGFYAALVRPVLTRVLPRLRYAAARLGSGSDVLGLDDAMSRDHDWGCRLTLLVDECDRDLVPQIDQLLEQELPERYRGFPVRFPVTWDAAISHNVEVATVADFATSRLGIDPTGGLSALDWLVLTGQSVLEVTAGPVFADRTVALGQVREQLRWYPPDVERYVLHAGWQRLAQEMPFVGRTADRGDELGSRMLSTRLAADLVWLSFALSRQWSPYSKWRGTIFRTLPAAKDLTGPLTAITTGPGWHEREDALAAAIEILVGMQRALGLPAPASGVSGFWNRPYRKVAGEVQRALLAGITDPEVIRLPPGIGSIEQWADSVDLLSSPGRRAALQPAYRAWIDRG